MNELSYAGTSIGGLIGPRDGQTTKHKRSLMRVFRRPLAWLVITLSLALLAAAVHADDGQDLLVAASIGDLQQVRALLEKGADINQQFSNGASALVVASQNGHIAIVRALLDRGAKVDQQVEDGVTALVSASHKIGRASCRERV